MAFRPERSGEGHSKSLALFQLPPINTAIQNVEWIEYRPVSQITPGSAIEFNIPGTSTSYLDLKRSRLHIKVQIVNSDGRPIDLTSKAALVNLPLHSLWSQVDLSLQQQVVSSLGTNYPYKAYLDALLGTSASEKKCALQTQMFYKDTASYMDSTDPPAGKNTGLYYRNVYTEGGKVADLQGPLYLDICQQDRFILDGVQVNFRMWPNQDSFRLMSGSENANEKVIILDAVLKVCTVKLTPGVQIAHADVLKNTTALYPLEHSVIKTYSIPSGQYALSVDDIFQGEVPQSLLVGVVSSAGFNGSYTKNPFNFDNFNCSFVGFYVDGQSVPQRPFQPVYNTHFVSEFEALIQNSKKNLTSSESGIGIEREEFPHGYCLYSFNLRGDTPWLQGTPSKRAHTRLDIKLSAPLPETCCLLLYAKFPGMMEIDVARNVIFHI